MHTIAVTLTEELKQSVEELAKRENLSTDEFIAMTLSEKVTHVDEFHYLQLKAAKGSRETFLKLLKKAPDVAPSNEDTM